MVVIHYLVILAGIVAALAVVAGVVSFVWSFNEHCEALFNYRFITVGSFIYLAVAFLLCYWGEHWYAQALHMHPKGDTSNGEILMVIGGAALVCKVLRNLYKTNLIYGIGGTLLQVPLLAFLAFVSVTGFAVLWVAMLPIMILGGVFGPLLAPVVRTVNWR